MQQTRRIFEHIIRYCNICNTTFKPNTIVNVSEEIGLFSNEHTIDRGRRLCEVNTYDDYQQIVRHYQSLQNVNIQADPQVLCRDEVNEFSFAALTPDTDENELNSVFSCLLQNMTSTSNLIICLYGLVGTFVGAFRDLCQFVASPVDVVCSEDYTWSIIFS